MSRIYHKTFEPLGDVTPIATIIEVHDFRPTSVRCRFFRVKKTAKGWKYYLGLSWVPRVKKYNLIDAAMFFADRLESQDVK